MPRARRVSKYKMKIDTDSIRETIIEKLHSANNLPSFPDVVIKLSELLQSSSANTGEISQVIRTDPALTSAILRLANTLAFNVSGNVSSIDEAVIRIGFKSISDMALSISVIKNFSDEGLINYPTYWKHCLSVAYGTQVIEQYATKIHGSDNSMYTAGLLHDIGILIFDQLFSEYYYEVLVEAKQRDTQLYKIEQEILGIDHAEVGAMMLKRWKLPPGIVDAVRFQYTPYIKTEHSNMSTKILHMADFACNNQGISNGIEAFPLDFSKAAWFDTGLEINDVPLIIKLVNQQTKKAQEILKVC